MSRPGKILRSEGPYRIEEEVVDYDDGVSTVIGCYVIGPEGRLSPLIPETQARAALDDLVRRDVADGAIDGVIGSDEVEEYDEVTGAIVRRPRQIRL